MTTIMDRETAEHFAAWLDRMIPPDEQHHVEQIIHDLLADDPGLIETHGWSELRQLAEARP
jgi:hypothetical protein